MFWCIGISRIGTCELMEKSIGAVIISGTGSTNDGVEGKHRTRGKELGTAETGGSVAD